MNEIILYHGTSTKYLPKIEKEGLRPRKGKGNYKGNLCSHPYVYLTQYYPVFYALNATKRKKDFPVIIRTKVNIADLMPDEDWVALAFKRKEKTISLSEIDLNPSLYKEYAEHSLNEMGNCCIQSVSKNQITDILTLPLDYGILSALGGDTNYTDIARTGTLPLFKHYTKRLEKIFEKGLDPVMQELREGYFRYNALMGKMGKLLDISKSELQELNDLHTLLWGWDKVSV